MGTRRLVAWGGLLGLLSGLSGPAAAFTISGKPMRCASSMRRVSDAFSPSKPGTHGTPASIMRRLAAALLPIAAIACGVGPMKVRPASMTAWANAAFSDRKP